MGNALDAIAHGGTVRVRVRCGHCWDGNPKPGIIVTVADNGSGIPDSMRTRLFEPFFSTKEKTGTGLGLWATENIVRKPCGRIAFRTANSPARHGTVFSLFFPFDGIRPDLTHTT
jgi:signal transduction histidine kinase